MSFTLKESMFDHEHTFPEVESGACHPCLTCGFKPADAIDYMRRVIQDMKDSEKSEDSKLDLKELGSFLCSICQILDSPIGMPMSEWDKEQRLKLGKIAEKMYQGKYIQSFVRFRFNREKLAEILYLQCIKDGDASSDNYIWSELSSDYKIIWLEQADAIIAADKDIVELEGK